MTGYIIRRTLGSIPVVLVVAILTFSILQLAPGDAAGVIAGDEASAEEVERIRESLGLDRPFVVQFSVWAGRAAKGDLGRSLFTGHRVTTLIAARVEPTLSLTVLGLMLSVLIGVPIGGIAAWRANSGIDRTIMFASVAGFSIPGFWLGSLLIIFFAVKLGWLPAIGFVSITDDVPGFFRSMILPAASIAVSGAAIVARMTRSSMLEVLNEDYIRTARAKGLSEIAVVGRHALKAASLPVVTVIGLLLAGLLTGVVVTETVFTIPGLGRLAADAVIRRDIPVVQGVVFVIGMVVVTANLVTDITYAYLDPRIKY
ncbi:MAG: ABC transporter permease [Planctomycetota bacterium]|nr:ABC transporter permease [Planctomycetota bacterium]